MNKAFALGLMNFEIPEAYGGLGLSLPDALAHPGGDRLGLRRREHHAGGQHAGVDAAHHRRHRRAEAEVPRPADDAATAASRSIACYACSEPDAGSDVAGMRTRVEKKGDELHPERPEALDHQRRRRQLLHHLRHLRSQAASTRASRRFVVDMNTPGREDRQEGKQDGPALVADQRHHLRGRARAQGEPRSARRAAASRWR